MIRWIVSGIEIRSFRANIGLVMLRVFAGLGIAAGHGFGKIPVTEGFIETVSRLGLPFPLVFAWAAALSEFAGGVFLALGLGTRLSAFVLLVTMATAAFLHHAGDPFVTREKALLYLLVFFLFFMVGSGKYGVDSSLRIRRARKYLL